MVADRTSVGVSSEVIAGAGMIWIDPSDPMLAGLLLSEAAVTAASIIISTGSVGMEDDSWLVVPAPVMK